eukprot:3252217-Lingulodinium_polyedra.AAC.1
MIPIMDVSAVYFNVIGMSCKSFVISDTDNRSIMADNTASLTASFGARLATLFASVVFLVRFEIRFWTALLLCNGFNSSSLICVNTNLVSNHLFLDAFMVTNAT